MLCPRHPGQLVSTNGARLDNSVEDLLTGTYVKAVGMVLYMERAYQRGGYRRTYVLSHHGVNCFSHFDLMTIGFGDLPDDC